VLYGHYGTVVAKEASELVLADVNFASFWVRKEGRDLATAFARYILSIKHQLQLSAIILVSFCRTARCSLSNNLVNLVMDTSSSIPLTWS
jgi:hypothetical protein